MSYGQARVNIRAWFKKRGFWVTVRTLSAAAQVDEFGRLGWLILARSAVAEHLQPVRVRQAGQQFGGALVHALRMFAT